MKSIDQQYSEIENAIFTKTKEKVDPYTRGIILGVLLANQPLISSNEEIAQKIKGTIKTYDYSNLSEKAVYQLRWGWIKPAVYAALVLIPIIYSYSFYTAEERLLSKIGIFQKDQSDGSYYISEGDYTKHNNQDYKYIELKKPANPPGFWEFHAAKIASIFK
jgi:hypothetical protein